MGAVTLGLGMALATGPGVAHADDPGSSSSSSGSDSGSSSSSDSGSNASSSGSSSSGSSSSAGASDQTDSDSSSTSGSTEDKAAKEADDAASESEDADTSAPDTDDESTPTVDEDDTVPETAAETTETPKSSKSSRSSSGAGSHQTAGASVTADTATDSTAETETAAAQTGAAPAEEADPETAVVEAAAVVPLEAGAPTTVTTDTTATPAESESVGETTVSDLVSSLLGADSDGDAPAAAPLVWALAAAARRQFESDEESDAAVQTTSTGEGGGDEEPAVMAFAAAAATTPVLVLDGSVSTGGSPSGVAVTTDRIYVTNQSSGTVTVYNRSDNSVIKSVAVGSSPSAIVVSADGSKAYVTDSAAGNVTIYNTADFSVVKQLKTGSNPTALALSPDGTRLLVVNTGANTLTKINTVSNVVATQSIPVGNGPSAVAFSADSAYAYVTNATDGSVTVITLSYNAKTTISGVGTAPSSVVVAGDKLYIGTSAGTVSVVSLSTSTVTGTINVGSPVRALAMSTDGTTLYAATRSDTVVAIASGAVISTITTDATPDTVGTPTLVVAADGKIYQTDASDNALRLLHLGTVAAPTNQPPVVTAPTVGTPNATTGVVTGSIHATDPDGNPLTYTVTTSPVYGTVTLNGSSFTYTPSASRPATATADSFVVSVSDGQASVTSTVTVTVVPPPSAQTGLVYDTSVATGGGPSSVAVSGDRIYVTNQTSGTVTVYNRSTNAVITTVTVGSAPTAVVVNSDGSKAYVANSASNTVSVIDTATWAVTNISMGAGSTPTALALTPDGTRLLVVKAGTSSVAKINTANNAIVTANVAVGNGASAIAVSADSKYAYVTNATDNTVTVITLSYNATKTITGVGTSPSAVVVAGSNVYVANLGGTVTVISAASNTVTGSVPLAAPVRALALSSDGATLFAATRNDTVVAVNTTTNAIVSTVTTDATPDTVSTPALAVGADGKIYQTDSTDNALRILHLGTGTTPVNQPPVVSSPVVGTPNSQTGVVTGSIVATDPDGNALTYTVTTNPGYGTVTLNGSSFTYTPSSSRPSNITSDSFVVTVSDGQAEVTSAVSVTVLPPPVVNQAPVVGNPVVGSPNSQTSVVTGSIVATDPDGDALTYTVTTPPANGTVTLNGSSFTYTPSSSRPSTVTSDQFVVTVSDGKATVTSTVTVAVLPPATGGHPGLILDGSFNTGSAPSAVALTSDRIYVTNKSAGTVTVYNRSDNSLIATVAVGTAPSAVVVNSAGSKAYVANTTSGTVSVIDTATWAVSTINMGTGSAPTALALTPDGTRLLVVKSGTNSIAKVNTANNAIATANVAVGTAPSAVAISADGKTAYVANSGSGSVTAITLAANSTKTIVGVGDSPIGVAIAGNYVYVSTLAGTIAVINAANNTTVGDFIIGAPVTSVVASSDGTKLYAATSTDTVLTIDLSTSAVVSTLITDPTPDANSAPALAVAADGTIYQTDSSDNKLRLLHMGIIPANDPPVVSAPIVNAPNSSTGAVTGKIVATDPDGNTLTYVVTTAPKYGTVTVNSDGTFTYIPTVNGRVLADNSPNNNLADQFVVTVSDGRVSVISGVAVAVLPSDYTLKTGTYMFEPPVFTNSVKTTMEYTRRKVMEFPVDPYKMRVHLANYNLLNNAFPNGGKGALDDISMYIGEAEIGADGMPTGNFVEGTQVRIPIQATLAAGQWAVSGWLTDGVDFNFDPDKKYIFSYAFGTPDGVLTSASGGASQGWGTLSAGDVATAAPTGLSVTTAGYLDVWFEYQYADQGQPSIFVVSNSAAYNNSGATGTLGELSTWVNQWAETTGGVVAGNIAVPAVFSTVFDENSSRWHMYDGQLEIPLDPDVIVYMVVNSSDAASDKNATLIEKIKTDTLEAIAAGEVFFPNSVQIISDIPPRTGFTTAAMEAERKALNDWIYTLPGGVDGVIRIADLLGDGAAIERMKPEYTIDGIHWTPAGVQVVVAQLIAAYNDAQSAAAAANAVPASVTASLFGLSDEAGASGQTCTDDPALPCAADDTATVDASGGTAKVDELV